MTTLKYVPQYFLTELNVGGGIDDSQTTGIVLQSVSGVDISKPGQICVTYSDPIDTSVAEWIDYTSINGSNELVGVTRGAEGFSAHSHLQNATVAFAISASHINDIVDRVNGTNGDLVTDLKATGAEVTTGTEDAKIVTPKALADAGIVPTPADGWTAVTDTWTYASASTITVPSGAASLYQNGDRIRLKQGGGYKYYVLTAVADTLLTVAVNTDYTVANAAITDVYYSHQANPIGYPHWFNCVPTTSASGSMTFSIDSNLKAKFCVIGSMCTFTFGFVGTTGGTPDYYAYVTLPITAQSINCSSGSGIMKNTHGYGLGILSDTGKCAFRKYDGGTMSNGQSSSIGTITYPF